MPANKQTNKQRSSEKYNGIYNINIYNIQDTI